MGHKQTRRHDTHPSCSNRHHPAPRKADNTIEAELRDIGHCLSRLEDQLQSESLEERLDDEEAMAA